MTKQPERPESGALGRPTFAAEGLEETRRRMIGRNPWYVRILLEALDLKGSPTRLVVDIGCGTGAYTRLIARSLPAGGRVVGIDLDPVLTNTARRLAASEELEQRTAFVTGDALRLPLAEGCAARIFCNTLLWLVPDPLAAIKEMAIKMIQWEGTHARLDPRPGGVYEVQIGRQMVRGEYIECRQRSRT